MNKHLVAVGVAVVIMLGGLLGCRQEARPFGYLENEVCLAVTGQMDGQEFSAIVQGGAAQGQSGAAGEAVFVVTYLSPQALSGVVVESRPGEILRVRLGELEAQGEAYEPLAAVGRLLLCESAVVSSHREATANGEVLVLRTADGATRRHDAKTGAPLSIRHVADGRALEMTVAPYDRP